MSKKYLSRRTFLRGSMAGLGVALALPPLEAMFNSKGAYADGSAEDTFFALFFWGGGTPWHDAHGATQAGHPDLWTPAQVGEGYTPSEMLAPLTRHSVNVITGLEPRTEIPASPGGQGDGHMRGFMVSMTGDRPRPEGFHHPSHTLTALRPTMDQVVAKHPDFYTAAPRFKSVQVGVSNARFHDYGHWNAVSYNGPDSINLPVMEPTQLFDYLFGVTPDIGELEDRSRALDAVLEDAKRLEQRLGARDRERVEAHLEHISEMQRRLLTSAATCEQPLRPSNSGDLITRTRTMADLLALAVSCGQTRSINFMLTSPATTHLFNNVGAVNEFHKTVHDGQWDVARNVTKYQMEALSAFLDGFAALPGIKEGESLLDTGVVYATSEYSEGYGHSVREFPILMAGGANGKLKKGVHARYPGETISRAQLTAMQALGLPFESFGWNGGETSSPIAEFLA